MRDRPSRSCWDTSRRRKARSDGLFPSRTIRRTYRRSRSRLRLSSQRCRCLRARCGRLLGGRFGRRTAGSPVLLGMRVAGPRASRTRCRWLRRFRDRRRRPPDSRRLPARPVNLPSSSGSSRSRDRRTGRLGRTGGVGTSDHRRDLPRSQTGSHP